MLQRPSERVLATVSAGPPEGALVGVEQEFRILLGPEPIDFRWVLDRLPVRGRRLDPADPLAYRCPWGGTLTADGPDAEVAIPPVAVEPGFGGHVQAWAALARAELTAVLPSDLRAEGYSTHLSVSAEDRVNERACRLMARRFAPALMLLTQRSESPGLLVRPRPGRLELGVEFVDGPALRAAAVLVAGAAAVCLAAASGDRRARRLLPPRLRVRLQPAVRRHGLYVDRTAFGPDLAADGRHAILRTRLGRRVTAQRHLEAAWAAARAWLGPKGSREDLDLVEGLVDGSLALPAEGLVDDPVLSAPPGREIGPGPFGRGLLPHVRPGLEVTAEVVTWDFVVFALRGSGRVAYACIPRPSLDRFLGALERGRLDRALAQHLAAPARGDVLASREQTRRPGLYDRMGDPGDLLAPERAPGGAGSAGGLGRRRGKRDRDESRQEGQPEPGDRPRQPGDHPRPARARGPRRPIQAMVVGGVAGVAVIAAVVAFIVLGGGGGEPTPGDGPGTSAPPQTTPAEPSPTTAPPTSAPPPTTPPTSASPTGPPPVNQARLEGSFAIGNIQNVFVPRCPSGPCDTRIEGVPFGPAPGEVELEAGVLRFANGTYRGELSGSAWCEDENTGEIFPDAAVGTTVFRIRPVEAKEIDGEWRATRLELHLVLITEPTAGAPADCRRSRVPLDVEGALVD